MDYGSCLLATIEAGTDRSNVAYKGIAVRLDPGQGGVSRGRAWVVYEHDTLRLAAAWTGQGFIDWNSINFNGEHQVHPRVVGRIEIANPDGPGWANPENPVATTSASSAATAVTTDRCRTPGRITGASTATATTWSSPTPSATDILEMPGLETDPRSPASRSSRGPWRSAPRPSG